MLIMKMNLLTLTHLRPHHGKMIPRLTLLLWTLFLPLKVLNLEKLPETVLRRPLSLNRSRKFISRTSMMFNIIKSWSNEHDLNNYYLVTLISCDKYPSYSFNHLKPKNSEYYWFSNVYEFIDFLFCSD